MAQNSDGICGTWLTESGKGKVKIEKTSTGYFGKIVWLREPCYKDGVAKMDKNNPKKECRTAPILGLPVLKNFSYNAAEQKWNKGTIYDPENGKTYNCTITQPEPKKLYVRGYIGISLIGRTETWFKVMDVK